MANCIQNKIRPKWWVAFAKSKDEVANGEYTAFFCRSRKHSLHIATKLIKDGSAIAAYAVKHSRTVQQNSTRLHAD